jgi:type II secretory pathway pseudopilin PulG
MKISNFKFQISNTGGFSLIELIIDIFVLGVGIIAILQIFPIGTQIAKSSQMATVAVQLGQEKIEEIISKSYTEILCPGGVSPTCSNSEDYGSIPNFSAYKRVMKITCVRDSDFSEVTNCSPDPGLKKIEVTVFWKSPLGVPEKNIKIAILISKR